MKRWLAWLYAPLFFGGFIGGALCWMSAAQASASGLLVLFAAALLVSFLVEWVLPYEPAWNRSQGDRLRDSLHALVNEGLNALGLLALPGLVALLAHDGLWPRDWPLWGQLLLAIVIADCGITLAHYASHRWAWLWRLHAVHHSVLRMYGFNGLLKHPLHQLLEATAGLLPLLVLGIPLPVAQLLALAIAIQLLLQHSNVDMRLGLLRLVFAWAPVHRFHHMKYGRAGDVNFGLFFNVWDWLLGTEFYRHDYAMRQGDLGIGSRPDYPVDYWPQLLEPFKAQHYAAEPKVPEALRRPVNPAGGA
ncbi:MULTISPECIES: sterol desaturase family protein [Pseudomonas]|uniref:sterol desaturase family protein n=1 Tax=Pseudomonas TaxID=286 RepID=UPI000C9BBC0A|nr:MULTISPECIES: sterol desaturase family protein [Pseudomonas]MCO7577083.1 sterol desaturase family protein [Pseudomonas protegens]MCO7583458.1 sterol desaturase family protein [Pseudomonas chlororaphis]MCO7600408.1 sterol desaturase family protein [Pseudomonas chlororaphis]MDC7814498.1 sterol desaturase family protein [Pseudomonas sp. BLCC-B112]MDD1019554.1 sterol desaturase family protein [Pseudomonas idahonensis]